MPRKVDSPSAAEFRLRLPPRPRSENLFAATSTGATAGDLENFVTSPVTGDIPLQGQKLWEQLRLCLPHRKPGAHLDCRTERMRNEMDLDVFSAQSHRCFPSRSSSLYVSILCLIMLLVFALPWYISVIVGIRSIGSDVM